MVSEAPINCKNLVADLAGSRLIFVTRTAAFIIDAATEKCIGSVPVASDTDGRVDFGPLPDSCAVGSWEGGLRAFDYCSGQMLWSLALDKFTAIQHFGSRPEIKVEKLGTVLLDFQTGRVLKTIPLWDVYLHPTRPIKASFSILHTKMVIENEGRATKTGIASKSFAVLSHAWSSEEFVWSSPSGHLTGYSIARDDVFMETKGPWFNVISLTFNEERNLFYALVTDLNGKPKLGLFSVSNSGKISYLAELPNVPFSCFLDRGRKLALSDGTIWSTLNGVLIKRLDWNVICRANDQQ